MAQVRVACPACQAILALNHPWPAGMASRCPRCQTQFALPDADAFAAPDPLAPQWSGLQDDYTSADDFQQPLSGGQYYEARDAQVAASAEGTNKSLTWVILAAVGGLVGTLVVLALILLLDRGEQPVAQQLAPARQPLEPAAPAGQMPAQAAPGSALANAPLSPAANPSSAAAPVFGATPVAQSPAASPTLAYRWNPGESYVYYFNVKAEVAGGAETSSGSVTLRSNGQAPAESAKPAEQQASGTGFIVSSDGNLVTCAHVVENATKIEVIVAGRTWPGQVVALDKPHDLAIVRIQAANLPVVPLANSDAVQLAQEVRAVGFPLSNVLGESVKITRGTVSGMLNSEGRRLFQVDASINPGNSGGPLVNEMGHVVGVASAKLAGEDIDGVGFAVISNDVQALLNAHRVPFQAAQAGARLEGPELARRVTPAVAMIKVAVAQGGLGRRLALDFNGHVSTPTQRTTAGGRRLSFHGFPETDRGKLVTTEFGELVSATGEAQLPHLLGALGPLTIEPLGSGGERSWRSERVVALAQTIEEESPAGMSFHFRRPRGFRNPFASQTKVVITPAMETAQYELLSTGGDLWQIKKRYHFKSLGAQGGQPLFEVNGEGTLVFNQKGGCGEKLDYRATVVRNSGGATLSIPISLDWRRATAAELEDAARRAAEAEAKRKADEARAAAPATPAEMQQLLADLAPSRDGFKKRQALETLKKKQPLDTQRSEVLKAVSPLTQDSDSWLRESAIVVMGAWGTKDTVPVLVKLLDQFDPGMRRAAIEALGKIKDATSAAVLAPLLANQSDQNEAARSLEAIGPLAEPAVLPLLTHADQRVRFEVCKLLGKIGGKDSVAAIKKLLLREQDGLVKLGAEGALKELGKKGL